MARRRGRKWKLIRRWFLPGLAAALLAALVWWVWLNVFLVLSALLVMISLHQIAQHLLQRFNYIPFGWDESRTMEAFEIYCRSRFNCADPLVDKHWSDDNWTSWNRARDDIEELRRLLIDDTEDGVIDCINPVLLPHWVRLLLLPDFCRMNPPGSKYSLWVAQPLEWRRLTAERRTLDLNNTAVLMSYQPLVEAPNLKNWLESAEKIKLILGYPVRFEWDAGAGRLLMWPALQVEDEGTIVGMPAPQPERFQLQLPQTAGAEAVEAPPEGPLPYEPYEFVHSPHPAGHLAKGWLYFGDPYLDQSEGAHWLQIDKLTHFIVMGTSGFGKSVFLNQILQGVRHNLDRFERVLLVDLKGGVELWRYQKLGAEFQVVYRLDDLVPLIADLVQLIEARFEMMRENDWSNWPGKKIFLVIDEYAQIQLSPEREKEDRQRKAELLANLNKISTLGRAAGVLIWAQLQKGTSDVMDSGFRANLASQVCFKVPNKLTAAGMFGSTEELEVDPVKLRKGRFILFDASTGGTHYLQARVQPEVKEE